MAIASMTCRPLPRQNAPERSLPEFQGAWRWYKTRYSDVAPRRTRLSHRRADERRRDAIPRRPASAQLATAPRTCDHDAGTRSRAWY
jgi:hypothetical protein